MNRNAVGITAGVAMLLLAGCGSTSAASTTTPTPTSSSSAVAQASAVPTTTDPCQVMTQSEASQLAAANYSAGKEETTPEGSKICVYGAQTLNVFEVLVATSSSASLAQSQWDAEKAQVVSELEKQSAAPGVTFTVNESDATVSGADRAATGTVSGSYNGHTVAISALYALKGPIFLALVDLVVDHQAPSISAMEGQGQTSLGRLP